jgi:hypothetical protein
MRSRDLATLGAFTPQKRRLPLQTALAEPISTLLSQRYHATFLPWGSESSQTDQRLNGVIPLMEMPRCIEAQDFGGLMAIAGEGTKRQNRHGRWGSRSDRRHRIPRQLRMGK